jgi:hypothetical protein
VRNAEAGRTRRNSLAKVIRKLWGGVIEYEDDDVAAEVRAFNNTGKSTALWLFQSRELYRSSLYVMEERERKWNEITHLLQAPIALMLGAYAIETLLKMVIVGAHCDKHGLTLESRRAREFLPTSHDLISLVKTAGLRVNNDDRNLLRELSRYSSWAGRYPIPLDSSGYTGPALFEAVRPAPADVGRHHPTWPKFRTLYPKLFRLAVPKTFKGRDFILKPKARN